jgi:hypothetical protein
MQGTMVMLLALSGMGCHHGGHAPSYDACYSACYDACYAGVSYDACYGDAYDACYSACYGGGFEMGAYGTTYDACYSSCYDSCYSSCYGGKHGGGLFSCFKGLFGHKKKKHYDSCYSACYGPTYYDACYDSCYSSCYGGSVPMASYGMPVYGTYTPAVSPQAAYTSPQGAIITTPGKAAPQSYGYSSGQATAPAASGGQPVEQETPNEGVVEPEPAEEGPDASEVPAPPEVDPLTPPAADDLLPPNT